MASMIYQICFLINLLFCVKSSKFCVVWTIRFCSSFISMWYKYFYGMYGETLDFHVSIIKSFNGKFTAKIDIPIEYLRYHCWYWYRKFKSLHTLFDKYLDHMLMKVWTKSYGPNYKKNWAFWQKMVKTSFWKTFL